MKTCSKCREAKVVDDYYPDPRAVSGLRSSCKSCFKQSLRISHSKNRTKRRASQREYRLRTLYDLTPSAYDSMLLAQSGGCAVCGSGYRLCVDHDHATGAVRGILCMNCNTTLGRYEDNPSVLRALAGYLDQSVQSVGRGV